MSAAKFTPVVLLLGAGIVGAVVGVGSIGQSPPAGSAALSSMSAPTIPAVLEDVGVRSGVIRKRTPRPSDRWGGCNDARAAGSAPLYRGEPGYREDMDGDDDGIA